MITKDQVGLQLYTVRNQTAEDMLGTLRQLAGIGYRAFEFAGFGGASPQEVRAVLDELGARALGAHVGLQLWDAGERQVLDDLRTIGAAHAIVPFVPVVLRSSRDVVLQLAERLNRIGEACAEEGIKLSYHNHQFEFEPLDGSTMYDILISALDPALVGLEVDVYWAHVAGLDAAELLQRRAGRVNLVHLKDMVADESREMETWGEGVLPWERILSAAEEAGAEWYIVEHDRPKSPMQDVERGLQNVLRQLGARR